MGKTTGVVSTSIQFEDTSSSELIENPLPSDDPTQRKPDISLAKEILDWTPKVELEEGLDRTIPYFRALLES